MLHGRLEASYLYLMSQTSIRRRRPRPSCSSSPSTDATDCPECLGGRALARCAKLRPAGAAAVSALLLLAATSSAFVPSRQVTWITTGTCTQLMATSSKKLKVENFQRQRERMEGSLVQNEEDQPKEKGRDETSSNNASNTSLDTSKKGGKPVGDPRVSGDTEGQDTDDKHKSLGKSESDTNDSILKESGVVRLQRAAMAELQRRAEKALEDAAAAATADDEEKGAGAKLSRGRESNGDANGARRNPNAMGSANASWMQKASRGPDEADESKNRPIISLDQLNRNIEKRLNSRDTLWDSRASLPRVEGTVKPPVRDTMSSLLSYNHIKGDWLGHQSASTYNGTSVCSSGIYSLNRMLLVLFLSSFLFLFVKCSCRCVWQAVGARSDYRRIQFPHPYASASVQKQSTLQAQPHMLHGMYCPGESCFGRGCRIHLLSSVSVHFVDMIFFFRSLNDYSQYLPRLLLTIRLNLTISLAHVACVKHRALTSRG